MPTDNIELFSDRHAIEVEQFTIVFRSPLDSGDDGRFQEALPKLKELFAAIDEPHFVQFIVGDQPPPQQPVLKTLTEFSRDGKPTWTGQFGENAVSIASRKYSSWNDIWPEVIKRLSLLIECVDPFKFVTSIEYSVTDSLKEKIVPDRQMSLLSENIFKTGSWVPGSFSNYKDPRWDFSAGAFISGDQKSEILERLEARSGIAGDYIVASITNTFSMRFRQASRVKEIFPDGGLGEEVTGVFNRFHDDNKNTISSILVDDLLRRMGL